MFFLERTLPTAAQNLALDEALLDHAEASAAPEETLRLWEAAQPVVVVGRASRVAREVRVDNCQAAGVPILRRCSGGTSIVAGPGCLMYAVVLSYQRRPQLRGVAAAHAFVLDTIRRALAPLVPGIQQRGTSDLALGDRKFSGNSVRCKRDYLLYHGTILYDFCLESISRLLHEPPRQPEYRAGRSHDRFLINLPAGPAQIGDALRRGWDAQQGLAGWLPDGMQGLVRQKYATDAWNFRF